jgi:hypothetical protein
MGSLCYKCSRNRLKSSCECKLIIVITKLTLCGVQLDVVVESGETLCGLAVGVHRRSVCRLYL